MGSKLNRYEREKRGGAVVEYRTSERVSRFDTYITVECSWARQFKFFTLLVNTKDIVTPSRHGFEIAD